VSTGRAGIGSETGFNPLRQFAQHLLPIHIVMNLMSTSRPQTEGPICGGDGIKQALGALDPANIVVSPVDQ
jgi:hypothetical protein